jgi:hypothetical protein
MILNSYYFIIFKYNVQASFVEPLKVSTCDHQNSSISKKIKIICSHKFADSDISLSGNSDDTKTTPFIEDEKIIESQLGYLPSNFLSVSARRNIYGTPLALKVYPLNGGSSRRKAKAQGNLTPFPTLYWFCCPAVGKAIANLERIGYVGILEERLQLDSEALDSFIKSHEEYATERWNTLSKDHQLMLENNLNGMNESMKNMIKYSGISGTDYKVFLSSRPSIKCLHTHYAHYRSQVALKEHKISTSDGSSENIVGKWIHEILENEYPDLIL